MRYDGLMLELPWYVFALIGAFFVAISAVVEKKILIHDEPLHFSGSVVTVGAILSLPFLFFVEWNRIPTESFIFLYAISFISTVSFSLTSFSMRRLEAGELSSIMALVPAVTALLAYLVLGESLSSKGIFGIGLIVVGLLILEFPRLRAEMRSKKNKTQLLYVGLALCAVTLYGVGSLMDRYALTQYSIRPFDYIVVTQTAMLGNFFILSLLRGKKDKLLSSSFSRQPLKVTGVAALLFLSRFFHATAISMTYVALANALKRTSVIFTIILAGSVLKERGIWHKLFAATIIIVGALALIL